MWVYRTVEEPHIWVFQMEERKDTGDPSDFMSMYCEAQVGGSPGNDERIRWQPIRRSDLMEIGRDDYYHGDRTNVTNKTLLNDFEIVRPEEER
jgi:hypothetical protein